MRNFFELVVVWGFSFMVSCFILNFFGIYCGGLSEIVHIGYQIEAAGCVGLVITRNY